MAVAEYCGNCDKRTLRKVGPCPECTPEDVESQTTDTQQLKDSISKDVKIVCNTIRHIDFMARGECVKKLNAVLAKLESI